MEKITDILMCEVVTEGGRRLGRLYDLRCAGEPEHGTPNRDRTVTELVYGTPGLWEVLDLKHIDTQTIPWSAVKSIERNKIIVRSGK